MNSNKTLEVLDDFGCNSSPVVSRFQQSEDFKLGIQMDSLRFGDYDYTSFVGYDMDSTYNMPLRTLLEDPPVQNFPQVPEIPRILDNLPTAKPENISPLKACLSPKQKKKTMVFKPFESFEATELTVKSLKSGIKKVPKQIKRAQSLGIIGFDL